METVKVVWLYGRAKYHSEFVVTGKGARLIVKAYEFGSPVVFPMRTSTVRRAQRTGKPIALPSPWR